MTDRICNELRAFLDANFPGSSLDDGYYFVRVEAPVSRRVLVSVDPGWCPYTWIHAPLSKPKGSRKEKSTTDPTGSVREEVTEWLVDLRKGCFDLDALKPARALAIIDPMRRLIFDINLNSVYATSKLDLDRFAEGIEDWFAEETRER